MPRASPKKNFLVQHFLVVCRALSFLTTGYQPMLGAQAQPQLHKLFDQLAQYPKIAQLLLQAEHAFQAPKQTEEFGGSSVRVIFRGQL